jgi:hypothetical protein
VPDRTLELRYEDLVTNPKQVATNLAAHLDLEEEPLSKSLSSAFDRSVGRWQRDLTPEQLRDVEEEAGALLRDLSYF